MAAQPSVHWKTGLFDCFEEASTCCYGFWCCPCLACTVSGRFGENSCLPLCDIFSAVILAACGIPLIVPPAAVALRAAMRNRYGIEGSICDDIAVSCFCEWCSWCQMHRELKHRQKTPAIVIVQNQNIIQMQPAPVMMAPAPVMMAPAPVMMAPVYPAQPAPVMMAPVYPAQPAFVNYPPVITMQ